MEGRVIIKRMETLELTPPLPEDSNSDFDPSDVSSEDLVVDPFGIETGTTLPDLEVRPVTGYQYTGTSPRSTFGLAPDYSDEQDDEQR